MMFPCIECGKNLDESNFCKKVKNKCKDCFFQKTRMSSKWKVFHRKMVD